MLLGVVGTLVAVAAGHEPASRLGKWLRDPEPGASTYRAPAYGLYLEHVEYQEGPVRPRPTDSDSEQEAILRALRSSATGAMRLGEIVDAVSGRGVPWVRRRYLNIYRTLNGPLKGLVTRPAHGLYRLKGRDAKETTDA